MENTIVDSGSGYRAERNALLKFIVVNYKGKGAGAFRA
jgi:hypothetical protein